MLILLSDLSFRKEKRRLNYPRQIARQLDMSERTVRKVLQRLEHGNLVRSRQERPGGRKYRNLTEAGKKLADQLRGVRKTLRQAVEAE